MLYKCELMEPNYQLLQILSEHFEEKRLYTMQYASLHYP